MALTRIDRRSFLFLSAGTFLAAACGGAGDDSGSNALGWQRNVTLRLGYFPNVTHVQPNVGLARGTYQEVLGANVKLQPQTFNAGPSVIEAIFAGELDASYIGPNPAINGFVRSDGKELRIVAGATSGGALLIVRPDRALNRPADFANKRVATPQLGNTQDVALRAWLKQNGLNAREQGGNVNVLPTANPDALTLFQKGDIDGAWVPEPWATRLVQEANGRIFLDERSLWPNGDFVTTHLIVRTRFLNDHPDVIERLLRAHVDITDYVTANPAEAKALVNKNIETVTSAALPTRVIDGAWENQKVTADPNAASLQKSADDAFALGFLGSKKPDLNNIYDLTLLNKVLREKGRPEVKGFAT
jgi:NitT/TauT family transport system substrate-binding protein